jgi:hypothetical protein
MASRPLVSVVTPSFNQAQFIEETLRSVELQQYRPIHQIVIDGGSTDGTVELLKKWEAAEHDPGYTFEWISEPDRGHADALNKGFDRVRGEFVGWLNSDDVYFDREVVSTSVATFHRRPDVDVVHGEVALITKNSGLQMIWCMPQFNYERALRGYIIPQPTVLFRRCVTDKHRLNPALKVAIDHIYWLQIGREHKFRKIHRVQAGDRDHKARISRMSNVALMETAGKACAAYGAQKKPSAVALFQDSVLRGLLRIRGLLYLLPLLIRRGLPDRLAFPAWVDTVPKAVTRQLTMRINNRRDMGPQPSYPTCKPYETD